MKKFFRTVADAAKGFARDECIVRGAALAYYTIFSLPPLLVLVFFVASWFNVSEQAVQEVVRRQLGMPIPDQMQEEQPNGTEVPGEDAGGGFGDVAKRRDEQTQPVLDLGPASRVIGILILLFSASGVFAQL